MTFGRHKKKGGILMIDEEIDLADPEFIPNGGSTYDCC